MSGANRGAACVGNRSSSRRVLSELLSPQVVRFQRGWLQGNAGGAAVSQRPLQCSSAEMSRREGSGVSAAVSRAPFNAQEKPTDRPTRAGGPG